MQSEQKPQIEILWKDQRIIKALVQKMYLNVLLAVMAA